MVSECEQIRVFEARGDKREQFPDPEIQTSLTRFPEVWLRLTRDGRFEFCLQRFLWTDQSVLHSSSLDSRCQPILVNLALKTSRFSWQRLCQLRLFRGETTERRLIFVTLYWRTYNQITDRLRHWEQRLWDLNRTEIPIWSLHLLK